MRPCLNEGLDGMGVLEPVCTGLFELVHEDSKDEKSACEASLRVDTYTITSKAISVHAMNVLSGRRSMDPFILNLYTRCRRLIIKLRPLYLRERTPVHIK